MPAFTDTATTQQFADLLTALADDAERDLSVDDAAERGWMVGEKGIVVTDYDDEGGEPAEYLITVRKISN